MICSIETRAVVVAGLVAVALITGGCSGLVSRSDQPAAVEQRGQVPPVQQAAPGGAQGAQPRSSGTDAQVAAYRPPAQPVTVAPQSNRAVEVLVRRAEDQQLSGDLAGASVSVERALRIAPEDAALWHRLAQVRFDQGQHERVVQLASKSNALTASADADLRADNWRLIARARRALGDTAGARAAEAEAHRPQPVRY